MGDELNSGLIQLAKDEGKTLYSGRPYFALAFEQDFSPSFHPGHSSEILIAHNSKQSLDFRFWRTMADMMKYGDKGDNFIFNLRLITRVGDNPKGILYISRGISENYGKTPTDDGSEKLNDEGVVLLKTALSHDKKPFWSVSNYNFLDSDPPNEDGEIDMSGVSGLIDLILKDINNNREK